MINKLCLLLVLLSSYYCINYAAMEKIVLTNKVLALGDGLVIDGKTMGDMLHVRRKMREILLGHPNHETKKMEGLYEFQGHKISLHMLARYEQQFEQERNNYAPQEFNTINNELQECLHIIKKDYLEATTPFMDQAHGVKSFMLKLIKESCKLRGLENSYLLQWGKTKEEDEVKAFNEYIITLQRLDAFCTDLINFIEDVMNSCPKAWKQFQELYSHREAL